MPNKKLTLAMVFILTTIFYIYTLQPSLAWGDGAKLQSEAISGESFVLAEMTRAEISPDPYIFNRVGVAAWDHPLYIMLGHIFVQMFPFVNALWLINFISALFGAAAVTIVFQLCFQFTESLVASFYASFALAVSHTFWWHSSTPEVYTLFAFLLLVSFYLFDQYERTGKSTFLVYSAFFLGLAASTHILAFLAIPALCLYYLLPRSVRNFHISNLKKLVLPGLGFLTGFSVYIIQFIRLSASIPLNKLMGPAVGSTFLSQLGTLSPILLGQSLLTYLLFLLLQFGPLGIILGGIGIRNALDKPKASLQKTVSFFVVYTLFGIFYRVSDQFAFFMMSYVFFAILIGMGGSYLFSHLQERVRLSLTIILALTILGTPFFYHAIPRLAERYGVDDTFIGIPQIGTGVRDGLAYYLDPNKRGDFNAYEFGSSTLTKLAPNSIVIAEWYTDTDEYFILRYFTKIQGVRSDVMVVGWPTREPFSFDSELVLQVIKDSFPARPVYLASLSDKFYAASKLINLYCIIPENNLYRLYPKESNHLQCLRSDSVGE